MKPQTKITNEIKSQIMRNAWADYKADASGFENFGQALSSAWAVAKSDLEAKDNMRIVDAMNAMNAGELAKAIGGKAWERHGKVRVYMPGVGVKKYFAFSRREWFANVRPVYGSNGESLESRWEKEDQMMRIALIDVARAIAA